MCGIGAALTGDLMISANFYGLKHKARAVIDSCETVQQMVCAWRWLKLLERTTLGKQVSNSVNTEWCEKYLRLHPNRLHAMRQLSGRFPL